jgi:hypothetical protein
VATAEGARCFPGTNRQLDLRTRFANPLRSGTQKNRDAVLFQDRRNLLCNIGVLVPQQLVGALDDRDAAAETLKKLSELQANISATQNNQLLGHGGQFHNRCAVEKRNVSQSINRGHSGTAAGINEDAFGREAPLLAVFEFDLKRFEAGKGSLAIDQIEILRLRDASLVSPAKLLHDIPLALADTLLIDGDTAGVHAVVGGAMSEIGDPPAGDDCLRRRAALVNAGSSDVLAFHQRGAPSSLGQRLTQRCPALAGTNDDGLVVMVSTHRVTPSGKWMQFRALDAPAVRGALKT